MSDIEKFASLAQMLHDTCNQSYGAAMKIAAEGFARENNFYPANARQMLREYISENEIVTSRACRAK